MPEDIKDQGLKHWLKPGASEYQIVCDPQTGWERASFLVALIATGGIFAILRLAKSQEWEVAFTAFLVWMIVLGVLWKLSSSHQETYLVDFQNKQIFFVRQFLGRTSQRLVGDFSEVECLLLTNLLYSDSRNRKKNYRLYGLSLVLKNGKSLDLTDRNERDFEVAVGRARILAEMFGTELHPPEKKKSYRFKKTVEGVEIEAY